MGDSKKTAIFAKYIIAFDGKGHRILNEGVLVVENDRIIFAGKKYEGPVDHVIHAEDRIVTPGFVNTHCHIDGSPMTKSFLEDIGNPIFYMSSLFEDLIPNLSYQTEESAIVSTTLSVSELLKSGTTTAVVVGTDLPELVSDILYTHGMRGYIIPAIRSGSWYAEDGKAPIWRKRDKEGFDLLQKSIAFSKVSQAKYGDRIGTMLGPTWTGNCTPELLKEIRKVAKETGMRVQIHASEAVLEFQEMLRRYGMTPVQFLESVGLLGDDLTIGHCIYISGHSWTAYPGDEDLKLLARYNTSVAHCPWVFARRGIIMESFAKYRKSGVNMSLGTDSCPQNMLLEMRYASIFSKIHERDSRATTAADVFNAATLGGAKVLGRDDLGKISPGAKADLVFFKLDSPRLSPLRDPIRSIVYYADPSDIADVMVDGKMIVKNGEIEGINLSDLSLKLQKCAEEMWKTIPKRDWAGRAADQISRLSYPLWEELD